MRSGEGKRWAKRPTWAHLPVLPRSHLEPPVPGWFPLPDASASPNPSTAPPASRTSLGSLAGVAGASTPSAHTHVPLRAFAPPASRGGAAGGAGQLPTPRSRRVQPSPLPCRGETPRPARRASPCPSPVQPSGALFGRSWPGAATGRAAGCSGASSEHNGRAGFPAQSRRDAHSAASETPIGAPAILE